MRKEDATNLTRLRGKKAISSLKIAEITGKQHYNVIRELTKDMK